MKQSVLARFYGITVKHSPLLIVALVGCAAFSAAYDLSIALLLQTALNSVVRSDLTQLARSVLTYGAAVLMTSLGASALSYAYRVIAAGLVGKVRETLFGHVVHLPISFFVQTHSGDLMSRLNSDVATLEPVLTDVPLDIACKVVSGLVSLAYLSSVDGRLAFYGIAVGLLTLMSGTVSSRTLRPLTKIVQERLSAAAQALSDLLAGIVVVKAFGLRELLNARFRDINDRVLQTSVLRIHRRAQLGLIGNFVFFATQIGLTILGCYLAIRGSISVGAVVGASAAIGPVVRLCSSLVTSMGNVQAALAGVDRVFEVLDQAPETSPQSSEVSDSTPFLKVEDLTFTYPGADRRSLDGLSLSVDIGEVVALVGPSGGGKSTLFRLLLGFYSPDAGGIALQGRPVSSMSLAEMRSLISYVPQQTHLFTGTIAENIGCAREGASMEDIVRAARAANAHDFIMATEGGYNQQVGERGLQLSGGQRQRIALARAILRDAPILLLDEVTASVDSESEALIMDALERLMKDKATLVIAHRLSTISNADRILVLDGGRVVESGRHEDLVELPGGVYRGLFETQSGLHEGLRASRASCGDKNGSSARGEAHYCAAVHTEP